MMQLITHSNKDMAQRKYNIGCSGSGWGIWENATGRKVMGCCSRIDALEKWYELEGWKKPNRWY